MEQLLFSINTTLPVVILILLGLFLAKIKVMDCQFTAALNRFAYNVTLPFLIYSNLSEVDIKSLWNIKYVLLCMAATVLCFFLSWVVSVFLVKNEKPLRGEFVQGSFRGSAILLAFAFIQNIYGTVTVTSLMVLATVPLYNILSVVILYMTQGQGSGKLPKEVWKGMLTNMIKNPIIIGIAVGMLGSALNPQFPYVIDKTIDTLASLMTPLALLGLGASFEGRRAMGYFGLTWTATLLKLLIFPALFLPLAMGLGLQGEEMAAFLIMVGSPTSVSCYVMARNTGHEGVLSSGMILVSTILGAFTLTFWVYILRLLGCI
ncbi:hypothetical protein SDC9_69108 [bioreactor metagenome]|uniref:Transporter YfdV n=1 Tax=bioreactor metagenome TaxID=1076179 RepID=A0A644Y288_9ZZZZ